MIIFGGDYRARCSSVTFENPLVFEGKIIPVEQNFSYQLSTGDESVASEGQTLGSIRSRLSVENQHRVGTMPRTFRSVKVSLLVFHVRIDANGDNQ